MKLLQSLNTFLGLVVALLILGAIAAGAWLFYQERYADKFALNEAEKQLAEKDEKISSLTDELGRKDVELREKTREIGELNKEVERQREEIERLDLAIRLLTIDHRLARIEVIGQTGSDETDDLATTFEFTEIDDKGHPKGEPRRFQIEGDIVYVDAFVVKFTDAYIQEGDPLRSTSICLFRRLFGENQKPTEGFMLDSEGAGPLAYLTQGQMTDFEREVWSRFWDYATNPEEAAEAGVRAAHGEAPFTKLKPGKSYRVELRASGGLSIVPEQDATATEPTT